MCTKYRRLSVLYWDPSSRVRGTGRAVLAMGLTLLLSIINPFQPPLHVVILFPISPCCRQAILLTFNLVAFTTLHVLPQAYGWSAHGMVCMVRLWCCLSSEWTYKLLAIQFVMIVYYILCVDEGMRHVQDCHQASREWQASILSVFSPAYTRDRGPLSLQCWFVFEVGLGWSQNLWCGH